MQKVHRLDEDEVQVADTVGVHDAGLSEALGQESEGKLSHGREFSEPRPRFRIFAGTRAILDLSGDSDSVINETFQTSTKVCRHIVKKTSCSFSGQRKRATRS